MKLKAFLLTIIVVFSLNTSIAQASSLELLSTWNELLQQLSGGGKGDDPELRLGDGKGDDPINRSGGGKGDDPVNQPAY